MARPPADEEKVQPLPGALVVEGDSGFLQRLFEVRRQGPGQGGERLSLVGVGHFDPQRGKFAPEEASGGDDRRHAVGFRQREKLGGANHLPREDEAIEFESLADLRAHVLLVSVEDGEGAVGARFHETLDAHLGRRRGDFLRALFLEAGAAVQKQPGRAHASRAWRNSRKKFSVVAPATSSKAMPRSFAISSATCFTNAGWLGLPRCGTGARYGASVS